MNTTSCLGLRLHWFALLFVALGLVADGVSSAPAGPYYGFYPSSLGPSHKVLRHNLFGFQIDMPSDWNFGVNARGGLPVVLLYPPNMNTTQITDAYQSIEIGSLPLPKISLEEAHRHLMTGMRMAHPALREVEPPVRVKVQNAEALQSLFTWQSKSQVEIAEWVTLVDNAHGIRSVTVRSAYGLFKRQRGMLRSLTATFQAFEPRVPDGE